MAAPATQLSSAPVKEGEVLAARYRIEKVIGVGGMGIVVSAKDLEADRRVALKFLLPQAQASDELIGRFMREAKSSVKLKGPHVARTHDVGQMDDGRAYIVMELLEGKDLGAEIKAAAGGPFPISDAVGWILQACEGLAEAHAIGLVHRDLKPANLFLARGDGAPIVKVLDFGISKSINPNASDMLSLTKTEMLLGSPLYMAPEQMRSSKYVDERSDIWGLGAIAYELLSGHVPFEADTLLDLCFKVAQESCIPIHEHRAEIPRALSEVVMRCLEKEPAGRWEDIGELATALEPFARESERGAASRVIATLAKGGVAGTRHPRERGTPPEAKPAVIPPVRKLDQTERLAHNEIGPDTIPASSAWGATSSQPRPAKKSWRAPLTIGALAVAVAVVSFVVARGTTPPPTIQAAPPQETSSPELPAPSPVVPTEPALPAPDSASTVVVSATATNVSTPKPKPKPVASTPPPATSGGFLKVRE